MTPSGLSLVGVARTWLLVYPRSSARNTATNASSSPNLRLQLVAAESMVSICTSVTCHCKVVFVPDSLFPELQDSRTNATASAIGRSG